ncbi:MAG: hypothetical protein KAR19_03705 [Bacteroidales bacterium]|nr:hypothetical protein [Bacteroidales bacterium]
MQEIEEVIDDKPSKKRIALAVELRNRSLLAFEELRHFNDTGLFKYKHPLIIHHSLRAELVELKKKDPDVFLDQYANARDNIKRYKSFLNNPKRDESKKTLDRENLKKHEARAAVYREVLQEE